MVRESVAGASGQLCLIFVFAYIQMQMSFFRSSGICKISLTRETEYRTQPDQW